MRRNTLAAVALVAIGAVAVPAALTAQTPTPPRHERGATAMRGGSAVEHIIAQRAELGLTDTQVTELREIAARLEEQNRSLIAQLRSARDTARAQRPQLTDEQRAQMRERRAARVDSLRQMTPEMRAVVEQLRANTETAMQQIRSTLTAEQQEKLRELRPAMRRQRESGDDRPARPGRQRTQGARAPRGAS